MSNFSKAVKHLARIIMYFLGPALRLCFGSVRNLFGWSVQAILVAAGLGVVTVLTGVFPIPWALIGAVFLAVSGLSLWLRHRWPEFWNRHW